MISNAVRNHSASSDDLLESDKFESSFSSVSMEIVVGVGVVVNICLVRLLLVLIMINSNFNWFVGKVNCSEGSDAVCLLLSFSFVLGIL